MDIFEAPVKEMPITKGKVLVKVMPLPIKKWHKKEEQESFTRPKILQALYDENTGGYATGLTPEEAEKYGKLVGFSLDSIFNPEEAHPTWSAKAFKVKLENQTMIFDLSRPMDFIKVKMMKASKFVANSLSEWEANLYPNATHYIFDELELVQDKATKVGNKRKAYEALGKMTAVDKAAIIQLLSKKTVRGRSADFLDTEIGDLIENQTIEFLRVFNMGREEVALRASVLEALGKNILTKEGNAIYYMGDMVAQDYEEAVQWFKDPNNSKMKVLILEKLEK
jgi:hypothetical protein